jgi:TPR repeat protein
MKKLLFLTLLLTSINATNFIGENSSPMNIMNQSNNLKEKKKNYKELISFLEKSTNGEYVMYLAVLYLNGSITPDEFGNNIEKDIDKSLKYFKKSIALEYYPSAAVLGSLYLYDENFMIKKDNIKKAKYYLTLAIEKEVYGASTALSSLYFFYDKDTNKGLEILFIGAEKGISTAQLGLATLYAYGSKELDIKQNKTLANKYLGMACSNKNKTKKVTDFCHSKKVIREENE